MKTKASVPTVPTVPTIFNNYIYRKIYVFLQRVLSRVGKIIFSGNVGTNKPERPLAPIWQGLGAIKICWNRVGTRWERSGNKSR